MTERRFYRATLQLRADLWRVPFSMCLGGLLLFLVTMRLDVAAAHGALALPWWASIGGPEDARAMLSAALGGVSTVLALIFSVALLVLSMAVSQFGPRILYRFVRDGVTQVTIGFFLATFVHALLTLAVTREHPGSEFVPQLTVLSSMLLVMVSFTFLVLFSHRTAMAIQTQNVVAHIVADVHEALAERKAVAELYRTPPRTPERIAEVDAMVARCAAEGGVVHAWRTGFVQEVDIGAVLHAAERVDAVVRFLHRPGLFVLEHAPLCQVLPAAKAADVLPALRRAIKIGPHRTLKQDFEFGIAQLVEIALRALSPAVNDTFTGLTCIDWLGDALRVIHATPVPGGALLGEDGALRLLWSPPQFDRLVKGAFEQIRQSAEGNPAVYIRLLQTFRRLAAQVDDAASRTPMLRQVDAVWEAAAADRLVQSDRADVEAAYRAARLALGAP